MCLPTIAIIRSARPAARPSAAIAGDEPGLVAPLRGWRRALGTLVVEGTPPAARTRQPPIALVQELARQLSVGDREHPAARGDPAAAPPARRHVQLARRSRRRHRQRSCASCRRTTRSPRACRAPRLTCSNGRSTSSSAPRLAAWVRGDASRRTPPRPSRTHARSTIARLGGTFLRDGDAARSARTARPRDACSWRATSRAQTRLEAEREALRATARAVGEAGRRSASSSPASRTR